MDCSAINSLLCEYMDPLYFYAGLAVIVLILFLRLLSKRQPKKITAYNTEDGKVLVTRAAITELVRSSCAQLDGVTKPSVRIKVKGKRTNFDVSIKLSNGSRLRETERTLQTHLRTALIEDLGIENLGKINIVATGFKSGKIATANIEPKQEEPIEEATEIKEASEDLTKATVIEETISEEPTEETSENSTEDSEDLDADKK